MNKGLSFCPTTIDEPTDLRLTDLLLFERRVRLKSFFQHNPSPEEPEHEFHTSKGWTPPQGISPALETFFTTNTTDFLHMEKTKKYPNLTREERQALKELIDNRDITIKPADKGGAIVVQDTDKYITECLHQLNNRTHYKRTGTNTTNEVNKKINDFIRDSKKQGHIRPITADHLITKEPRTAKFYTLSKIHKQGTPGRPIIKYQDMLITF